MVTDNQEKILQDREEEAGEETGDQAADYINKEELEKMAEAGLFYGRSKTRTHPKMRPFIITTRNGIEIIDIIKTMALLEEAGNFLAEVFSKGGKVLLVGTQPAVKKVLREWAEKYNFPYVVDKWVGGALTNLNIIRKRVNYFTNLKADKESGRLNKYTKKEISKLNREMEKMEFLFAGIEEMDKLPEAMFVFNPRLHRTAINEAKKAGVPVVAVLNSDSNPSEVDYPIPANDNALPAVNYIVEILRRKMEAVKGVNKIGEEEQSKNDELIV